MLTCLSSPRLALGIALASAFAVPSSMRAQSDDVLRREGYLRPSEEIASAVLAPRHLNVTLSNPSPNGRYFLKTQTEGLPSLADFARPYHNLGGVQVDPRASRARQFTARGAEGFEIIEWEAGRTVSVQVPRGTKVSSPAWSPDGGQLAFFGHSETATHIFVADAATGRSRQVTRMPVLATLVTSLGWTPDSRGIVTVLIPEGRGAEPRRPAVPTEPVVRMTRDARNQTRTYASLLESPLDMTLLEYFATGQLAIVDVRTRAARPIGRPAMIRAADISPDGRYVRVERMERPFSYVVPVSMFGTSDEIWSLDGRVVARIARRPLREGTAPDTTQRSDTVWRQVAWHPSGSGLSYLQLEPQRPRVTGDSTAVDTTATDSAVAPARRGGTAATGGAAARGGQAVRRRDRVMHWLPPFDSASLRVLHESDSRLAGLRYSADGRILFLTETSGAGDAATTHDYAVFLDEPGKTHTIRRQRADAFHDARGTLMMRRLPVGVTVVRQSSDGQSVYLGGTRWSRNPQQEGPRSFVDRVDIRTGRSTRAYESEAGDVYEQLLAVLDDDLTRLIVSRESPTMVANSYLRDVASGELRRLTDNRDYTPHITSAQRRLIQVTRVDGFRFNVSVTLPADYVEGTRLPALFWFYPREFASQEAYDRSTRTFNRNRFPVIGPRSMDILVTQGYAVVSPDAPIVGESGRMNDRYVPDLRNNLAAIIDALDSAGVIDRRRLAIGGHSYGAFSAVNAMAHTPFFKAGIAGAGNYNRTLTPYGFQSERRTLWDSRETYLGMSPLLYADQINGALLLYHGTEDQNVGTAPINSERLFHALNGQGKIAALYMYPFEDHGPATQESLLDLWTRWVAWLDRYVKNPAGPTPASDAPVTAGAGEPRLRP